MHETATTKKSWNILLIKNISKRNNRENRKKLNLTKQSRRKNGFPPFMKVVANSIFTISISEAFLCPTGSEPFVFLIDCYIIYYLWKWRAGHFFCTKKNEQSSFSKFVCAPDNSIVMQYAIRQALRLTFCVTCCLATVGVGKRYLGTSIDLLLIF